MFGEKAQPSGCAFFVLNDIGMVVELTQVSNETSNGKCKNVYVRVLRWAKIERQKRRQGGCSVLRDGAVDFSDTLLGMSVSKSKGKARARATAKADPLRG